MRCIILAAGYGTRLYPITYDLPKALLSVAGRPIIEYLIEKIETIEDIQDIYVVTNAKFYTHFLEWRKGYNSKSKIEIINDGTISNEERLGAIGDLYLVVERERIDEEILVVGGDNIFEFPIEDAHRYFKNKGASVVCVYDMKDPSLVAKRYGVVHLDEDGRITSFEEKPERPGSTLISTAIYFFSKDAVYELKRCIQMGLNPDNTGDFIKYLSKRRDTYGFILKGVWFDIGNKDEYIKANQFYGHPVEIT